MYEKAETGRKIWHMRNEVLHMTQEAFAELVDVTPETISNLERAVCYPSLKTIVRIAEACKVTTDYLLGVKPPDAE